MRKRAQAGTLAGRQDVVVNINTSQRPSIRREDRSWYPHDYSALQHDLAAARKDSLERLGGGRRQRHRIPAQTRRYINERVKPHLGNVKIVSGANGKMHLYYGGAPVIIESEESEDDVQLYLGDGDGHGHIVVSVGGHVAHGRLPGAPHGRQNNIRRRR